MAHKTQDRNKHCEYLTKQFCELRERARKSGLNDDVIFKVFTEIDEKSLTIQEDNTWKRVRKGLYHAAFLVVILSVLFGVLVHRHNIDEEITKFVRDTRCVIENNGFVMEISRPKTDCRPCKHIKSIPIVYNISKDDFRDKYAYSNVPVLVKGAVANWTALDTFSVKYFRDLYNSVNGSYEAVENECQFFPYKSEFRTLEEALNMSDARAVLQDGEKLWYFGWSNCHKEVANILRQHYQKPYFLPSDSESSLIDWIFMGGPGLGAFVHIDFVQRPSWQAQISGKKTWTLIPTPECEHICGAMNVTVEKGDIIVLDTNQWYHATYIHPGDISITIGSEYD